MSLKRFILITASHEGSPIALQAKQEGLDVLTGVFADWTETYTPAEAKEDNKPEDKIDKERRLKTYSGMVAQVSPEKVIKALSKLSGTEKEQTFVMVDMNYCFKYSEELLALNIPGNFPLLEDRILEADREKGKKFVEEYYTGLKLADVHDFNNVQEALDFLEENMEQGDQAKMYVLKANDAGIDTVVPLNSDSPQQAYDTIKTALEADTVGYEGKGFILEQFIPNVIELTPQCIFYDGAPVYYSCDIEIKKKSSGLSGRTTGCAANLVFRTNPEDKINKLAFPPIIYQMAKQRKGMFIWDASILIDPKDGEMYFGEFCCNRWGWDATQTEITMAESTTKFFEDIMAGQAPYDYGKFGFAVRVFNELDDKDIPGHARAGVPFSYDRQISEYMYPMYVYQDEEGMKSSGYGEDLCVVTCDMGSSPQEAAEGCYSYLEKMNFKDYSRLSLDDVLSIRYPGSILNRYNYGIEKGLYQGQKVGKAMEEVDNSLPMDVVEHPFKPTGNPLFDALQQSLLSNQKTKEEFEAKLKLADQQSKKELADTLEKVRTEMSMKSAEIAKTASQTNEFANALNLIGNVIKELRSSIDGLKPEPIDLSGVQQALALLPDKTQATKHAEQLIRIGDSFIDLKKSFVSLEKSIKEKQDPGHKLVVKAIAELRKDFAVQIDKLAKSNETVVISGGGSGQRYDIPPNLPVIQNITLTNQNTEYSCTLPLGTKRLQVKIRGLNGYTLRYGWNSGDTIGSAYLTLEQGETLLISNVRFLHDSVIYLNCPDAANQVAEVETWTA